MRKYRIEEKKFKDGRSEFTPQFGEKSEIDGSYVFYDFFKKTTNGRITMVLNTYEECIEEIEEDKKREAKPIEVKIHEVD
jgi:hypothetical protein